MAYPPIFTALKLLAEGRGAEVKVEALLGDEAPGEFITNRGDPLLIIVRAKSGDMRIVDDVVDSLVLAHEMGHHRRKRAGEEDPEYSKIGDSTGEQIQRSAPKPLRQAVVAEERAAWVYAHEDLKSAGFKLWSAFNASKKAGLTSYITNLEPDED